MYRDHFKNICGRDSMTSRGLFFARLSRRHKPDSPPLERLSRVRRRTVRELFEPRLAQINTSAQQKRLEPWRFEALSLFLIEPISTGGPSVAAAIPDVRTPR